VSDVLAPGFALFYLFFSYFFGKANVTTNVGSGVGINQPIGLHRDLNISVLCDFFTKLYFFFSFFTKKSLYCSLSSPKCLVLFGGLQ